MANRSMACDSAEILSNQTLYVCRASRARRVGLFTASTSAHGTAVSLVLFIHYLSLHNHGGVLPGRAVSLIWQGTTVVVTMHHDRARGEAAAPHERYGRRDCRSIKAVDESQTKRIGEESLSGSGRAAPSTGFGPTVCLLSSLRTSDSASTSTATTVRAITHLSFHDEPTPQTLGFFFFHVDVSRLPCPYQPFSTKRVTSDIVGPARLVTFTAQDKKKTSLQQQRSIFLCP